MSVYGRIEAAQPAKSGKTLGLKVNGKWYRTKEFSLEHEVGNTIDFEVGTSSLSDGTTLYWVNDYRIVEDDTGVPPNVEPAASTKREHNRGRPDAADNYTENAMLLRFIGQCFAGYPFQTTDEPMIRNRARMLYLLGKDILSGKIEEVETGPRRAAKPEPDPSKGVPGYLPSEPTKSEDDPDDDIPF
jgi:hypothetical protein